MRITLTPDGRRTSFDRLSEAHVEELARLAPTMRALWRALDKVDGQNAHNAVPKP